MEIVATSSPATRSIGELCVSGDWAWAHGDLLAMRDIAQQLAIRFGEPIHCDLIKLMELCVDQPAAAAALWARLKEQLYPSSPPPSADGVP